MSVCQSVCLFVMSTPILALQATRWLMSDTNSFTQCYKEMKYNWTILLKRVIKGDYNGVNRAIGMNVNEYIYRLHIYIRLYGNKMVST